jgi:hypothetical protein
MRRGTKLIMSMILMEIILLMLVMSSAADSPPEPHNVEGRVFNDDGTGGVPNGIPVAINDTNSSTYTVTYTNAPPVPELLGSYATTIDGVDNDTIIVTSWNKTPWNKTHYGTNTTKLASTTTYANIILINIRPSETNVTILTPTNNTLTNTGVNFTVTANITIIGGQNGTNCQATIQFSTSGVLELEGGESYTHNLGNITLGTSVNTTWNLSGVTDGSTNITVTAECDSDDQNFDHVNSYIASNITVEDVTAPLIYLESPLNRSWIDYRNITLYYNVTDGSGIKNCSLYLNGSFNQSSTDVETEVRQNFTINETVEGSYSWLVSCYDNSSNLNNGNSTEWIVNVDTIIPNVSLINPENNSVKDNNTIIFEYNVTDGYGVVENCSLVINGVIAETNTSIELGVTQNFTRTLERGNYSWSINCTDAANNIGSSLVRYLNVTDPDLTVNSSNITFGTDSPVENTNITINATVSNVGDEDASNVVIRFFENDPDSGGTQIGGDKMVDLAKETSVVVSVNWTARIGSYDIFVIVDPPLATNGSIHEINESNNKANRTIEVPAWQIFYGNITADIFLDTNANLSIFRWLNETDLGGNIFIVDSDSLVSWTDLEALSRNASGNLTMDDFEEIDEVLNLSGIRDSVNATYTDNGIIKNTTTFTVYSSQINNTPIVNSTNTSQFVTGILWDKSDNPTNEYNGSQDIVFITTINQNTYGGYGIYDYEIRIPANLRRYKGNQNTVDFYTELK